jgi:glutamine amidotransferase
MAYTGGEIPMSELMFRPMHSLIDQSLHSRMGEEVTNGDGFGVGWFGDIPRPGVYKSVQPAWNDSNLHDLCDHVSSGLFLAHIRASTGSPVQYTNCHPFRHDNWLFVHNGLIPGFSKIRRRLLTRLDDEHFAILTGSTDSELMFALALQCGLRENPREGIARMVGLVEQAGREAGIEYPVQMTLGFSNGADLHAVRYSSEGKSRTLFHSSDLAALEAQLEPEQKALLDRMGNHARAIVSEPLSDLEDFWEPIPESSFVTIRDGDVAIEPFAPMAP